MTGSDRERRLAREHYERQQRRRAEQAARARRRSVLVAAVFAGALVVAGLVVAGVLSRDGDSSSTASPGPASTGTATTGTGATVDCTDAPGPVPSPSSYPSAPAPDPQAARTATIATTCGDVIVELLGAKAPATVGSFAFLARKGFFDRTPCHRLTTSGIHVLQCGDPTGSGSGGPGYSIPLENAPPDGRYPAGTLAMARSSEPNSGGSQFFLVYQESQLPAPGYSVFGRVTAGLDVLKGIAAAGADDANGQGDGAPRQAVGISRVSVS